MNKETVDALLGAMIQSADGVSDLIFIEGKPELADRYGTPFAITASGNSHPVARTPAPDTDLMLENPPSDTGVLMLLLSTDLRTNSPIVPDPVLTRFGTRPGDPPASPMLNRSNARVSIVEPLSRMRAAVMMSLYRWILQFSKERLDPT